MAEQQTCECPQLQPGGRGLVVDEKAVDIRELGELIAAFDASTAKLKASHDALQGRVADLTGELSRKNEELSKTLAEVNALKNYLANILESITDGVLAIDLDRRVVALNAAATEAIPGLTAELEGSPMAMVLPPPYEELGQLLVRALEEETHFTNVEVSFVDEAGTGKMLSVAASPIRSESGAILGAVETFRDLTALKALEERANRQERLAALGEMAAGVAHEIRNPLGGIELYASVIKRNLPAGCKEEELADKVMAAAGRLNRIVEDMLTFTRNREPVRKPVPIEVICRNALEFAAVSLEERETEVTFKDSTGGVEIMLDADLLSQAFLNVVLNAVQVMEVGKSLQIASSFAGEGSERVLVVRFADQGPGIPADARDQIFNPFFSLRKDGTGLGLAIVHKIVQDHGGSVEVIDRDPCGSVFVFRLPAGERQSCGR